MDTLESLAETYGETWKIWTSARGVFACATRRLSLDREQMRAGLSPTLIEDNTADLAAKLAVEAARELRQ